MKEGGQDSMSQVRWAARAQRLALIAVIAGALLGIPTASQPTTASAAGARSPSIGSCSFSAARPLATTLWHEPVSGAELIAALYGSYEGSHFCGALYAEAALTLPAGYDAQWICAALVNGENGACGAGYDARWTCLTLQARGTGACDDLGPGPKTGQHTFFIASHAQLEHCDSVEASLRGFFTATVSTTPVCG
jgi:hypothetical protein